MLKLLGKAFLIIAFIAAVVYGWIYFTINADVEYVEDEKEVTNELDVEIVDEEKISNEINVLPTL